MKSTTREYSRDEVNRRIERSEKFREANQPCQARLELQELMANLPAVEDYRRTDVLSEFAASYFDEGQYAMAKTYLDQALTAPLLAEWRVICTNEAMAEACLKLGQLEEAIRYFKVALRSANQELDLFRDGMYC